MQKFSTRIDTVFETLKSDNRTAFLGFVMAGDPDYDTALKIIQGLPESGVDILEIGMPFTDPMADGVTIQHAGQRALKAGQTLQKTLDLVADFRKTNTCTPVVLMGYYNPIYIYGVKPFLAACTSVGVDGVLVVDLPPEEDKELCIPAYKSQVNYIRLATPTTVEKRIKTVMYNASGFVYYVSMAGITGTKHIDVSAVKKSLKKLRPYTNLPIVVGFGVKTAQDVMALSKVADGVVVGSAIVNVIAQSLDNGQATDKTVSDALRYVQTLTKGL